MENENTELNKVDVEELRKQLKQAVIDTEEYCLLEIYVSEDTNVEPYANFQSKKCTLVTMALAVAIAEDTLETLKEKTPLLKQAIVDVKKIIKKDNKKEFYQ